MLLDAAPENYLAGAISPLPHLLRSSFPVNIFGGFRPRILFRRIFIILSEARWLLK
jgi:hypothetical protein